MQSVNRAQCLNITISLLFGAAVAPVFGTVIVPSTSMCASFKSQKMTLTSKF